MKAWQWTIAGTKTTFGGTIGLDQTVDLSWSVPVTESLIAKHGFLASLGGETIRIPIGGSVTKPKLDLTKTLSGLAQQALKAELKGELQDKLGKELGGLLGDKPKAGEDAGAPWEDPAELLRRADDLWKAGQQDEAGALYWKLHEEYGLTIPYALNKKRVKERMKAPAPKPPDAPPPKAPQTGSGDKPAQVPAKQP